MVRAPLPCSAAPAPAFDVTRALAPPGDRTTTNAASGLQQSEDLSSARGAFGRLNAAVVPIARASRSDLGDGVNVVDCPMAGRSGPQPGTAIRNPCNGRPMPGYGHATTALRSFMS
jgi:hypothetical protein